MNKQSLQVLVVDPEDKAREQLATFLHQQYSYDVDTVAANDQALARVAAAQRPYDVVLIDDFIPPQAGEEPRPLGLELMQRIQEQCPQTAAILFQDKQSKRSQDVSLRAGAFRYLPKEFDQKELAILIREARAERQQKKEQDILGYIRRINVALLSGNSTDDVLPCILQGIQGLGFERSWLYLLSDDKRYMELKECFGIERKALKQAFPAAQDRSLQMLTRSPHPRIFHCKDLAPGHFLEPHNKSHMGQWACAPLLVKGQVIGTLSADYKSNHRFIYDDDLEHLHLFVSQTALTLDNARQRTAALETFSSDRRLLAIILEQTVRLLGARYGVLYKLLSSQGEIVVVATYNSPVHVLGEPLKIGDGMAGKLLGSSEPGMIVDDYNHWEGKYDKFAAPGVPSRAVLGVRLEWRGRPVGALTIGDSVGRKFTKNDASLLKGFAERYITSLIDESLYQTDQTLEKILKIAKFKDEVVKTNKIESVLSAPFKFQLTVSRKPLVVVG